MNLQILKEKIKNKKFILVDCFNTILYRRVEEIEVEKLYFEEIEEILKLEKGVLYQFWIIIKKTELCIDGREERTFKELVNDLYLRISYDHIINISQENFYKLCVESFISVEKNVCELNREIVGILIEAKKQGKIIICVSDFFLPKEHVDELFKYLEIGDIFNQIFISSDIGKRKSSGNIYNILKMNYSLTEQNSIMIGDNKISDYLMAEKNQIEGIWYKKSFPVMVEKDILKKYLEIYDLKNRSIEDYFKNYSFIFYTFFERLYKKIKIEKINKIFFFSREGEFLKRGFEEYLSLKKEIDNFQIENIYLYVSRKSTFLPSLESLEKEKFIQLRKDNSDLSIKDFLKSLNLYEIFMEGKKDSDIEIYNKKINNFFESNSFLELIKDDKFKKIYELERKRQKKELFLYLKKVGFASEEKACIVDIGWKGTIQDNLFNLYMQKKKIYGFYLGLFGNVSFSKQNYKEGLIFSEIPKKSSYFEIFKIRNRIIERIIYASHGTCVGYKNGKPKLGNYGVEEKELYEEAIKIQEKIIKDLRKIEHICKKYPVCFKTQNRILKKLYTIFILDLNKEKLNFINKLDGKMSRDFGNTEILVKFSKKELIKKIIKLDTIEKFQKIIFYSYQKHFSMVGYFLKKIIIFKEKNFKY